jgi:hypothetical protein
LPIYFLGLPKSTSIVLLQYAYGSLQQSKVAENSKYFERVAMQKSLRTFALIYYINVQSPNLDLKQGIKPKAGNFLSGKREGEGGGKERLRWVDI